MTVIHVGNLPAMGDVTVRSTDETDTGWSFDVLVTEGGRTSEHTVHLTRADYENWSWGGGAGPAEVAQRCVELLVERVKHHDIMDTFDLREALQLYPPFEEEVRKRLA